MTDFMLCALLLAVVFGAHVVQSEYIPTKFHCDTVAHLSRKPYVEKSSDLTDGRLPRLATVGVTRDQLSSAFHCDCTVQPFDSWHRQPHGTSALVAIWQCGQLTVEQFSSSVHWNASQWEEAEARLTGNVDWGQVLEPSWWLSPRYFNWNWFKTVDAQPYALFVASTEPHSATALLRKIGIHDDSTKPITWDTESVPALALRSFMVNSALETKKKRIVERVKSEQAEQCSRHVHQRVQECERSERARCQEQQRQQALREQPRVVHAVNRHAASVDRIYTQEDVDAAYARGISNGQASCPSSQAAVARHAAAVPPGGLDHGGAATILKSDLGELLRCTFTQDTLMNPVLNRKSGLTYSRAEMERWIRTKPSDPQTQADTVLEDLVPNILVRQIVELYDKA